MDDDLGRADDEPSGPGKHYAKPSGANPLRPLGILSTLGWLTAAIAAASMSATLVLCVFVAITLGLGWGASS